MSEQRSPEAQAYRAFYGSARWKRLREAQLRAHPLCAFCLQIGRVTAATVVDHIKPHKGQGGLFFSRDNLQSLCDAEPWRCHSRRKQSIERLGYDTAIGLDGWPVDPNHPANRK